jgi:citrate lyase subunit beta/citryl-CoA lyase
MQAYLLTGLEPDAVERAWASGAEAVVLDLAHAAGTPGERQLRLESAVAGRPGRGPALHVAVGAVGDPASLDELAIAMAVRPDGVVLLDAGSGRDATCLAARMSVAEARLGRPDGETRIIALAASAAAQIVQLSSFVGATERLSGLVHDPAALAADLRAAEPEDAISLARGLLLVAARAAGVLAIDRLRVEFERAAEAAKRSARRGFGAVLVDRPEAVAAIRAAGR